MVAMLSVIIFAGSCSKEHPGDIGFHPINDSHLKIAVVSDIHYMDPSLLKNNAESGAAFQAGACR